jgi:hypothetical protein
MRSAHSTTSHRLVVVLAVGFAGSFLGCGGSSATTVRIPAVQTWTKIGLDIHAGQTLTITARGEVEARPRLACGPWGFDDQPQWKIYSVMPDVPHMALIGKIGAAGAPFVVGRKLETTVNGNGALYLGVNDRDAANNHGGYEATITVR